MLPISEAKEKLYDDLAVLLMSYESEKITFELMIDLMRVRIDLYEKLENE